MGVSVGVGSKAHAAPTVPIRTSEPEMRHRLKNELRGMAVSDRFLKSQEVPGIVHHDRIYLLLGEARV